MRTFLWLILGYGLAIAASLCAIAAGGLFAIGVASHVLLRREPGMGNILNYDPSDMAARAPLPGALALGFAIVYFLVARRLRASAQVQRVDA